MSEFADLLREALTGAETVDPERNEPALRAALETYRRRNRTVRWMAVFSVGFMTLVAVWAATSFFGLPDDASAKQALLPAVGFLFSMSAVGISKMWFAMMLNHYQVMMELKRMQLERVGPLPS